jgi:hypothetical protein
MLIEMLCDWQSKSCQVTRLRRHSGLCVLDEVDHQVELVCCLMKLIIRWQLVVCCLMD